MRNAIWVGGGIAGLGKFPMLGSKKKVDPTDPVEPTEPTEPTDPSTPSTVEPMLVTPAAMDVIISSASDLEIDWGDGTIQTVKSGDDYLYEMFGLVSNQYVHTYTDSYEDKVISIKHLDGKSPIQFLSSIFFKTVERWYSEGYQPFRMFNEQYGVDREMAFYGLGKLLETVPDTPPPKTVHLSGMFSDSDTFNQDISGWDVSSVTNMTGMFYNAKAFNQDLSNWCVTNITSEPDQFAVGSILASEHKPVWGTCPSDEEDSDGDEPTEPEEPEEPTEPLPDPIHALFDEGIRGIWFDPNDMSTMFQDAEATIPVTAIGQTVGCIKCKRGDKAWVQATASKQPLLQHDPETNHNYLLFDGIDDEYNYVSYSNSPSYIENLTYLSAVKVIDHTSNMYSYINSHHPQFHYRYNQLSYVWGTVAASPLPPDIPGSSNIVLAYVDNAFFDYPDREAYINHNGYIFDVAKTTTKGGIGIGCSTNHKFANMAFYGAYTGEVFTPKSEILTYLNYFAKKIGVTTHVE